MWDPIRHTSKKENLTKVLISKLRQRDVLGQNQIFQDQLQTPKWTSLSSSTVTSVSCHEVRDILTSNFYAKIGDT